MGHTPMAKKQWKWRKEVSAGGVVVRAGEAGPEVLIAKDAGYQKWVLPKGLIGKGESAEETAVREVEEEGGVRARIVAPLGDPETYVYTARGMRVFKEVHYFLMTYETGSVESHDHEMEAVKWVSFAQALETLAFDGAREVVRRAQALVEAGGMP